ncbi:tetratricopeptide repeat protein [Ditylenchus destructor]|uniref:Tetratricopeptide repeat protein n=1 Tax=Ditylenchus destructor TaxID=166010 RepID=A0AAD4MKL7_9BILA|nr:tetratricopeptide repeat protein [Ditylenchus destructor]
MSENHPSLDESKPSIGKVLDDEDNKVAEFIQFLRRKVSSGLCTDDQIKVLEDVRESLSTLFSVSGPSYEVRKSKPLSDICVGAEGPTQPYPPRNVLMNNQQLIPTAVLMRMIPEKLVRSNEAGQL